MESRRNTICSNSINAGENSERIPMDLTMEILLRLPVKSIAKFRCVSKLWASTLCLPYFTDLFLTKSSSRPRLLFACQNYDSQLFFFSTPQSPNPDENSSAVVATNRLRHSDTTLSYSVCTPISGFVCFSYTKNRALESVIYNPSTRQSLTLPTRKIGVTSFFGYDPIDKQFKILSIIPPTYGGSELSKDHQVLGLEETKKLLWRKVECCIPHFPSCNGSKEICINGVLYYQSSVDNHAEATMIICFHVRSEKFSFVKLMQTFNETEQRTPTLINYNGKLGLLTAEGTYYYINEESTSFQLWVLEDAAKHKWLKHIYVLPPMWQNVVGKGSHLTFVGVTPTKEIVLSSSYQCAPFIVIYYNFKRNTIKRVEIQGMEACQGFRIYPFLDHVENVKLMKAF